MPDETTQQEIRDLTQKVSELNRKFEDFKRDFDFNKDFQLKTPVDVESKQIITDIITDTVPQMWWDEIFFLSSVFESVSRFAVTAAVTISDTGLELSTSAGESGAVLYQENDTPIIITNDTYFSNTVTIVDVSEVNFDATILSGTAGYVSLQINAGTIKGVTNNGSSSTTVTLDTASNNGAYLLEAKYKPGYKVDFYVNGTLKGSSTSNLPKLTSVTSSIIEYGLAPAFGGALVTSANVNYFSILQKRNKQ